jgi:hypothetical protein
VGGLSNLKQAVLLKTRIAQGQLLEEPEFGLSSVVGRKGTPSETLALKHGLMVAATSDPRIESAAVVITREGNVTTASFSLIPAGLAGNRPVTAVVGGV